MKVLMPFTTSWKEEGILHLEHLNLRMPEHGPIKQMYYDTLGFGIDSRRAQNIAKGSGTLWANIGTSQIHMPTGEVQVVPGSTGLIYRDLEEVKARLRKAEGATTLKDTKFGWQEDVDKTIVVTGPHGNVFRLHQMPTGEDKDNRGMPVVDPRGGHLPSAPSLGVGLAYIHFRCRRGTVGGIARFYRKVFNAEVEVLELGGAGGAGGASVRGIHALVRAGPVQHLGFQELGEGEGMPEEYDGHHICVYLTRECFCSSFMELERMGLIFVNPIRNYGKADTLEKALDEHQYRIKNIVRGRP
ncbi:unnamed protein product [Discosporangium mesarthrocarpum]